MTDPYACYQRLKFDRPHERVLRITMDDGRMNTTDQILHGRNRARAQLLWLSESLIHIAAG
jgi:hypothetical protein